MRTKQNRRRGCAPLYCRADKLLFLDPSSIKPPFASLNDLVCMKLAALAQQGAKKDFVDIY